MKPVTQYLTAVFELRPSRRKAAAMERVRSGAEAAFWDCMEGLRAKADGVVPLEKKERTQFKLDATAAALRAGNRRGLTEAVQQGLARDVAMAASSYVELKAGEYEAEWPTPASAQVANMDLALATLAATTSKDAEALARADALRAEKGVAPRPLTIARERDAELLRKSERGGIVAVLNILRATDKEARKTKIEIGVNAATGTITPPRTSKTRLVIPLSCSKWHENKFLSGGAVLRSSLIIRKGEQWFMLCQFEFAVKPIAQTAALGVDRGLAQFVTMAHVDQAGGVRHVSELVGNDIGLRIRKSEMKAKAHQRRTGRSIALHKRYAHNALHDIANSIVGEAKGRQAIVVLEKLDGLKQTITAKRVKGARRSTWQKSLKKAQFAKLESMVEYKARAAGVGVKYVVAGGTSQTCSACGHRDKENRKTQERFACTACAYEAHADVNAAVQIARRGVMKVSKGDKMDALHRKIVEGLRTRDDGGLGPLAAGAAGGFVAGRGSADAANEQLVCLTVSVDQNAADDRKNAGNGVIAERPVAKNVEDEAGNGRSPSALSGSG